MKKLLTLAAVLLLSLSSNAQLKNIELTDANTVLLKGPITFESVNSVAAELMDKSNSRGNKNTPLYLVLDSPGGYIDAGNDLLEITKTIKNLHTVTLFAASMAAALVEQITGSRYITDSGIIMFHRAAGGVSGQFETGELESRLDFYKGIVLKMENRNASRMGKSIEAYKASVINELWINGNNAVLQKANDELVTVTCNKELTQGKKVVEYATMFGVLNVTFSKCPLLKAPLAIGAKDVTMKINTEEAVRTVIESQRKPFTGVK